MSTRSKDNPYLVDFDTALAQWSDERLMSRDDIRAFFLFSTYMVNLADEQEWEYSGHSYKRGAPLSTLVIKAVIDDGYVVCFVSGRTFANCVKIFLRRVSEDRLEWRSDRFR